MRLKAWFRAGQALLKLERTAEAAFAFAMSSTKAPLPQLVEVAAALEQSPDAEHRVLLVKEWLRAGDCPELSGMLAKASADLAPPLQLVEGDASLTSWLREQLECSLCLDLVFEPTTTPCGHTVCRPCLARVLDHAFDTRPACPMCRSDLAAYWTWLNGRAVASGELSARHGAAQLPLNGKMDAILQRHFGSDYADRRRQVAREEAEAGTEATDDPEVPIFICSLAMPAVACSLHIFEPRYRLMMRRCIDSGRRQFGMCLQPGAEYGTMLHILEFDQLPDGRSHVKTVGIRRFRVVSWGEKDGYATGRIQWIDDMEDPAPATDMDEAPASISPDAKRLSDRVESLLAKLTGSRMRMGALEDQLGPKPQADGSDGAACPGYVFWCLALSQAPTSLQWKLCFDDEYRHDAAKRLQAVLALYDRMPGGDAGDSD
jgi:Lon protease-like protein